MFKGLKMKKYIQKIKCLFGFHVFGEKHFKPPFRELNNLIYYEYISKCEYCKKIKIENEIINRNK